MVKHFSDDDIANIIFRSAKAARDRRRTASRDGDGVRFLADGKYFKKWQDVIEQFKKDLEAMYLMYDVKAEVSE